MLGNKTVERRRRLTIELRREHCEQAVSSIGGAAAATKKQRHAIVDWHKSRTCRLAHARARTLRAFCSHLLACRRRRRRRTKSAERKLVWRALANKKSAASRQLQYEIFQRSHCTLYQFELQLAARNILKSSRAQSRKTCAAAADAAGQSACLWPNSKHQFNGRSLIVSSSKGN